MIKKPTYDDYQAYVTRFQITEAALPVILTRRKLTSFLFDRGLLERYDDLDDDTYERLRDTIKNERNRQRFHVLRKFNVICEDGTNAIPLRTEKHDPQGTKYIIDSAVNHLLRKNALVAGAKRIDSTVKEMERRHNKIDYSEMPLERIAVTHNIQHSRAIQEGVRVMGEGLDANNKNLLAIVHKKEYDND